MVLSLKKIKRKNKRAALELSIGTIVILVLAMSMLILGLILIRTIFKGATENVADINDAVRGQIKDLFVKEDEKALLYLTERKANIKMGEPFGVGFGIQNVGQTQKFRWQVNVEDDNIRKKCGVTDREAEAWMTTGASGNVNLLSGDQYADAIIFNIPEGSVNDISQCIIRYKLIIKQEDGDPYITLPFNIDVDN